MILSVETPGFSYEGDIIAIGLRTPRVERLWKRWEFASESEMLGDFARYFVGIDDKIVIGFNILKFDLITLALKLKGTPEFDAFMKKVNFSNVVDLFVVLTFLNKGFIQGLGWHCRKYGVDADLLSYRDVAAAWEAKDFPKIEKNLLKKLGAVNGLFLSVWDRVKGDKL